ncbi:JmjC domain-containing protein [Herbaspirillum sp. NPDC101397]|uniref:JmjC domain-containing protein n=1 Tax=Herbaspirillum sp. NPDC101397 TaxID=3364006 RepID=UPI00383ABB3E
MRDSKIKFEEFFGLDKEKFFTTYWQEYSALTHSHLTKQIFNYLKFEYVIDLINHGMELDDFSILREGRYCQPHSYMKNGLLSIDAITHLYEKEETTIYIKRLEKYDPEIESITRYLSQDLYPVIFQTCLFLSAKNQFALDAHFDAHDAFIIQVNGEKKWKIWPSIIEDLPSLSAPSLYTSEVKEFAALTPPIAEYNLHPGEILYLPRNTIHQPVPTGERSAHLNMWMIPPKLKAFSKNNYA